MYIESRIRTVLPDVCIPLNEIYLFRSSSQRERPRRPHLKYSLQSRSIRVEEQAPLQLQGAVQRDVGHGFVRHHV
jgi:hypothetical protein